MTASKLVIFGTSSQARLAHYYFCNDSDYEVIAFTVDREYMEESSFCGLPVCPFEDIVDSYHPASHAMFVALGYTDMNRIRASKYEAAKEKGYELTTYVSSRCSYLSQFEPGDNCLILEDNTIQPFVRIGNDVTLWSGNHIGHDVTIGDHVFVTSHVVISGFTVVEDYCFLGVNSTLRDDIRVARRTLIGAGAAIMKSTEEGSVWLAPRATLLEKKSHELKIS